VEVNLNVAKDLDVNIGQIVGVLDPSRLKRRRKPSTVTSLDAIEPLDQ